MTLLIRGNQRFVRIFLEYEYIEEIVKYEVSITEQIKRDKNI